MKAAVLHIFIIASLLSLSLAQSGKISINTNARMMQDQYKRTVIFHGVNVVYKIPPYIPDG